LDNPDEPRVKVTPVFSATSNLKVLHSNFYLPEATLPNLKELNFFGDIKDMSFFTKISSYKSLNSLKVKSISVDELDKILELIGSQLFSLNVLKDVGDIGYFKLVNLCPNLVTLNLKNCTWTCCALKIQ